MYNHWAKVDKTEHCGLKCLRSNLLLVDLYTCISKKKNRFKQRRVKNSSSSNRQATKDPVALLRHLGNSSPSCYCSCVGSRR